jgi:hypothetical protein
MTTPVNPYPDQTGYGTGPTGEESRPVQGYTGPYVSDTETPQEAPKPSIEGYYQQYLGRGADQGGLDFWTNAVKSGQSTMEDVANAFQNSQEGQNYGVNQVYQKILNRDADPEGLSYFQNQLQNGSSINDVANSIYGSQEAQNLGINNKPILPPQEAQFDPVYFDLNGNPTRGYQPGYTTQQPVYPQGRQGVDFDYGYGGPAGINQGILPQTQIDPVMDFVKNITQQPQYLQNAYQQALNVYRDPATAARMVLGSLR